MAVTAEEKYLGRSGEYRSPNNSETRVFVVRDAASAAEAVSAAYAEADDVIETDDGKQLFIGPASWDEVAEAQVDGSTVWFLEVTIKYAPKDRQPLKVNDTRISWSTTGGTAHYKQAYEEVAVNKIGTGVTAAGVTFGGAIGAQRDSIDGVDVIVPQFTLTVVKCFVPEDIPDISDLYQLTGRTNNANVTLTDTATGISLDFLEGELLFKGSDGGSLNSDGNIEITFALDAAPNLTNETINTIDPETKDPKLIYFDKRGFEYVWVRYVETPNGTGDIATIVQVPKLVIVNRVYKEGGFSLLGIAS